MSMPNRDEIRGKLRRAKGEVKEKVGRAANNPDLIQESQGDKARGRAQENLGKARRKVGDAIRDVGDAIRK